METRPTPLAAKFAAIRAATTSNDDRGTVSAALHALISAILARIFGRLEQILLLWQSGTLPTPPLRTPQVRTQQLRNHQPATATPHRHPGQSEGFTLASCLPPCDAQHESRPSATQRTNPLNVVHFDIKIIIPTRRPHHQPARRRPQAATTSSARTRPNPARAPPACNPAVQTVANTPPRERAIMP